MDDKDFVIEVARRINTFFEQSPERARMALSTPLFHARYASVAHLLGELCMPKIKEASAEQLQEQLLLVPKIEDGALQGVEVLSLEEFQERAKKAQEPPVH